MITIDDGLSVIPLKVVQVKITRSIHNIISSKFISSLLFCHNDDVDLYKYFPINILITDNDNGGVKSVISPILRRSKIWNNIWKFDFPYTKNMSIEISEIFIDVLKEVNCYVEYNEIFNILSYRSVKNSYTDNVVIRPQYLFVSERFKLIINIKDYLKFNSFTVRYKNSKIFYCMTRENVDMLKCYTYDKNNICIHFPYLIIKNNTSNCYVSLDFSSSPLYKKFYYEKIRQHDFGYYYIFYDIITFYSVKSFIKYSNQTSASVFEYYFRCNKNYYYLDCITDLTRYFGSFPIIFPRNNVVNKINSCLWMKIFSFIEFDLNYLDIFKSIISFMPDDKNINISFSRLQRYIE